MRRDERNEEIRREKGTNGIGAQEERKRKGAEKKIKQKER